MKNYEIDTGNITYADSDILKVVFGSMVLKVESINKNYGKLKNFVNQYDLWGITNGKLLIMSVMHDPPFQLMEFAERELLPLGFKEKEDFAFVSESLVYGVHYTVTGDLFRENPCCRDLPWLGSIIKEKGNFVWLRKSKRSKPDPDCLHSYIGSREGHRRRVLIAYGLHLLEQFYLISDKKYIEELSGFEDYLIHKRGFNGNEVCRLLHYLRLYTENRKRELFISDL